MNPFNLCRSGVLLTLIALGASEAIGQGVPDPNTTLDIHNISVSHHPSVALTNATADARFAEATAVLQDGCTADDQRCCVQLQRSGTVGTFPASLSGAQYNNITTSADLTTLLSSNIAYIKVVTSIMNACGVQGPGVLGCAPVPGSSIVLVGAGIDGRVWVHEFGHNKGLSHNSSDPANIMYPSYSGTPGTACRLVLSEAQAYHTGSSSQVANGCVAGTCPSGGGEPNNSCAAASSIATGSPINGYICPSGDADWYVFSLAQTSNVTVTMTPPSSPCLDYDIQLFGACATYLNFSSNSGCAQETIAANGLAAGSYRVYVAGYQGASSASAPYTLTVTSTPVSTCGSDPSESNNSCAAAAAITPNASALSRYLCPQGDTDWYVFSLAQTSNVTVTVTPPSSPCLDYDVQLFGACGSFINYSAASGCAAETITANGLAAGSYRIYVVGYQSAWSATAPYTIAVTATGVSTCGSDPGEPNNSCAAAAAITPNASALSRYLCPQGDTDWYVFTLAQTSNVTVTMTPPSSPCLDYDIQLFGACGAYLNYSAAIGCGVETITANGLAAGSYRVYVVGSQNAWSATAPYTISVAATGVATCGSDPSESNDTCAAAAAITPNASALSRYLCPQGDTDWYVFTLAQTSNVTVTMTPPPSPCLDYDIQLFGACGAYMNFSAATGCAAESITANGLAAGTYRVYVVGFQNAWSATAPYTISVTATAVATCGSDPSESNDTCAAAAAITPNASALSRYLCPQGDTDWYVFTLTQTSNVAVTMTPPSSPCLDYDIQLFGACGAYMNFSALAGCATETISANNLTAGSYRVYVVGFQNAWSATAPYTIVVTATPVTACIPEPGPSTNGTCAGAAVLSSLTCITGALSSATDEDWFQVTYSAGQLPRTITLIPPASPCSDYDLELYGACGSLVGSSLNTGCINDTILVTTAGTYRIRVIYYSGTATNYTLIP